jgi:magnesium transporter
MGLALGCALGLMAYFSAPLQDQDVLLGCVVASALLATLFAANHAGALISLLLKQLHLDPALTAGPFIATVIDAIGITIYFQITVLLINHL